jgi:hypothetical protein
VSADDRRHLRKSFAQRIRACRQVDFEQFAITPIRIVARPQTAGAVAAPFVHEDRDAACGQRFGEGQVVPRGDAQRRQPQQGRAWRRRRAKQQSKAMAVIGDHRETVAFLRQIRVCGGPAHRGSAAPK